MQNSKASSFFRLSFPSTSDATIGWFLGLTTAVVTGWPAVLPEGGHTLGWLADDAFYYAQIARNVAFGRGFTFDGVHATNGFHPLWLLLQVPIQRLVPGDMMPIRCTMLLQSALMSGASVLLWRSLRARLPGPAALCPSLLLLVVPRAPRIFWWGMESSLLLFLLVVAWNAWLRFEKGWRPRHAWVLGSCCALVFLARLEGIAALGVASLIVLRERNPPAGRWPTLMRIALPATVVGAGYIAWNLIAFDLLLPVSGSVKLAWNAAHRWPATLLDLAVVPWAGRFLVVRLFGCPSYAEGFPPGALVLYAALTLGVVLALVRYREALRRLVDRTGTRFLLGACLVQFGIRHLAMRGQTWAWHLVPITLATVVVGGVALSRFRRIVPWVVAALALLAWARVPLAASRLLGDESHVGSEVFNAAEWVRDNLPPEAHIGSRGAGAIGYFSHGRVVNLDGLANDAAFYRRVALGGDMAGYLRDEEIGWLTECYASTVPESVEPMDCSAEPCRLEAVRSPRTSDTAGPCFYRFWRLHWDGRTVSTLRLWR